MPLYSRMSLISPVLIVTTCAGCMASEERAPRFDVPLPHIASTLGHEDALVVLRGHLRPDEHISQAIAWRLPALGRVLSVGVGESQWSARTIAVDEMGHEVDLDALVAADANMKAQLLGKLDPGLHAKLLQIADSEHVDIVVQVRSSALPLQIPAGYETALVTGSELQAALEPQRHAQDTATRSDKASLLAWMEAEGLSVRDDMRLPYITARVPTAVLRKGRFHDEDVVAIYADEPADDSELLGYAGHASMNEASLSGGLCGSACDGAGVSIGIWERDGANPFWKGGWT